MYHKKNLNEILQQASILTRSDLLDKTILLRSCLNLTVNSDGSISDLTRLTESYPAIEALALKCKKLIVTAHMGRPTNNEKSLSLFPVYQLIKAKLDAKNISSEFCQEIEQIATLTSKVIILENIRFFAGEESEDEAIRTGFILKLTKDVDYYVNDAFPDYRESVSTFYVAQNLKSFLGPSFIKEVKGLIALDNPVRPYTAVIGGAKLSDKIDLLSQFISTCDKVLIGGAMAYTFLKALNVNIGNSLCENDKLEIAKDIYKNSQGKIILPLDHMISSQFNESSSYTAKYTNDNNVPENSVAIDIGPKTINYYISIINQSKTIILNGPMGVYEWENSTKGTYSIYSSIINNKQAYSILGGGDSVSALNKLHLSGFDHISTGGGAMLSFISKSRFPTLDVILDQFDL